jgi:hypothetical protein
MERDIHAVGDDTVEADEPEIDLAERLDDMQRQIAALRSDVDRLRRAQVGAEQGGTGDAD